MFLSPVFSQMPESTEEKGTPKPGVAETSGRSTNAANAAEMPALPKKKEVKACYKSVLNHEKCFF